MYFRFEYSYSFSSLILGGGFSMASTIPSPDCSNPNFAFAPKTPLVCWDHDNKRIHWIHGTLKIVDGKITVDSQRLGGTRVKRKEFNVTNPRPEQIAIGGQTVTRIMVDLTRTGLRGVVAYFFGVKGEIKSLGLGGGHLTLDLQNHLNYQKVDMLTAVIDSDTDTIERFDKLNCVSRNQKILRVRLYFKQSSDIDYHTYAITEKNESGVVRFHLNDVNTFTDDVQKVCKKGRPILDDLERYFNIRFGEWPNPEQHFLVLMWDPEKSAVVGSQNEHLITGKERIFPVCIKDTKTQECKIKMLQSRIVDGHDTGTKKYYLSDLTEYLQNPSDIFQLAIATEQLEAQMTKIFLSKGHG